MASELTYRGHDGSPSREEGGTYTAKAQKGWLLSASYTRRVGLLLQDQRFLCVLLGIALASTVFLAAPLFSPSSTSTVGTVHLPRRPAYGRWDPLDCGGGDRGEDSAGAEEEDDEDPGDGGAGFVGSHLVDQLIGRGHSVIVVDNFFTGRKENLAQHFGNPRFELIRHDVVEPLLLEVDQIYHLACPASPVHYKFNPLRPSYPFNLHEDSSSSSAFLREGVFFLGFSPAASFLTSTPATAAVAAHKTNVVGTLNMLGLAKRVGARFLLTSTSEVYGDPLQHPQVETYWGNVNPIGVRSCYDEGKRTAETLTMDYHRAAALEVRIARIFNTYGPRMCIDDGRVVSNFVAQALRKEPLTVYGDGKQTRSFQYVSDLVQGLIKLMEGEHVGPFNLGNPGEFTMLELAQVVQETIDPNAKIEFRRNTEDDPHKRKPDIAKAKELLGWEPTVTLRRGLPLMVSDFRRRIFGDHAGDGTTA
ncbi:unnamed protein product [Spirodela intermedia]|uniref:UDP-glucuronate decarboxylase n=1 Tax=Spirodela intermedia TaxID=51605 RepID=A0A7I8IYD9_SPIIN|nr:unnamed protein product [Spirodela intermedia]CAA6662021.1 unnamed protein product [Spirodela intermedia]